MAYTPTSTRGIAAAASKNPTTSVTSSPETQRVTFNNKRFSVPVGSSKEYIQARASNIDATNRGGTQTDLTQFQNPTSNTSVNSTNMGNTGLILPYTPAPVKTSDVGANNAGLIEGLPGYTYQNGAFTQTPTDTTGATTPLADQVSSYLKSQKDFVGTPPSAEKIYQQSGAAERDAAKQLVNTYTGQLNTIVANRDASNLALTGQGRGIPEAIIGGQQAQISKEAAINALPIQALLANAQGNYELAQTHLDETFKIRMADATSQYQYRSDLYKSVYDIADKAQQRQLDAKQKTADQNFSLYRDFINFNRDAYKDYGIVAGSALAKLPTLDTSDPNFMQNFSNQQSEASKIYSKFAVSKSDATKNNFTSTQLNKGTANSGLSIETFKTLNQNTQNVFINNNKFASAFTSDLSLVKNNSKTKDDVIAGINDTSALPQEAKNDLINLVNNVTPEQGTWWSSVKRYFGL